MRNVDLFTITIILFTGIVVVVASALIEFPEINTRNIIDVKRERKIHRIRLPSAACSEIFADSVTTSLCKTSEQGESARDEDAR